MQQWVGGGLPELRACLQPSAGRRRREVREVREVRDLGQGVEIGNVEVVQDVEYYLGGHREEGRLRM